ncbi:hypothetical protein BSL78_15487 [Apostichopus japonicus]|uniref:GIY-YIG domain-containing protein n=1 Tax=Stichopus japonicus TaxID=307972 RepID=A0A2G8KI35_STIJA|nr:hypothetical protein BSL78_15487 [Apostichopus japonicus]
MRWRALFILADTDTDAETSDTSRDEDNTATTDAYGLKSRCRVPALQKTKQRTIYISQHSNHPPAIIKNIPPAIERTVSGLSSNQDTFKKAAPTYNHALRSAGYNYTIKYQNKENKNTKQNKKRRSRKITWYNPTYSKNVKTNFAADFLKLIDKQFPQTNKLHKIFNRSTVKIKLQLYEKHATDHQVTQLKGHERNEPTPQENTCNCREVDSCPLRGNCLVNDVIYKATVTSGTDNTSYIGLASEEFKKRYNNHTKSFQHDRYKKETELSKHIWQLKEKKAEYSIHWEIVSQSKRTSGSLVYAIFAKKSSKLPPSKATRSTREASSSLL